MKPSKIVSCALLGALLAVPASALGDHASRRHGGYDPLWFATAIPPEAVTTPQPTEAHADSAGDAASDRDHRRHLGAASYGNRRRHRNADCTGNTFRN